MEKFRVLSDLHLDINDNYPFKIDDDIFTVICGDTSGTPSESIKWINNNVKAGIGVSGNHLPYNTEEKTIQQLREELAAAFPITNTFTYLDCETEIFSKEVDGILFIGTCMYTDMHIKHKVHNPTGNFEFNKKCSASHMNDYRWGIKSKEWPLGMDNDCKIINITPQDYYEWFSNAYSKIDKLLDQNESLTIPKPVVLITHHPLITDFFGHNGYVENADHNWNPRDFNYASYGSDMKKWLKRHTSVKCYCCGHIHDVDNKYRHFDIIRKDGSRILVINNARGYVSRGHDWHFNKNTFVNTTTWQVETIPFTEKEEAERKSKTDKLIKNLAWFI